MMVWRPLCTFETIKLYPRLQYQNELNISAPFALLHHTYSWAYKAALSAHITFQLHQKCLSVSLEYTLYLLQKAL